MISATAGNVVNGASMEDTPTSERRSVPNPAAEKYMFYVRIAVFFSVIVITCYGVILIQCFSLLLLLHSHRAYRAYIRVTEQIFGSIIMIVTYLLCPGTKLVVTGDFDRIRARGKSIMISNHQIYPDWFYLWAFTWLRGCHGDLKIMLIEWLKYLPIFGQGMWFFEFIFMKQKWEKDKDNMQKHLLKAKDPASPLMLLIFPEGTLNTPENIKKSQAYAKKVRHKRQSPSALLAI
ncbi:Acyl-CoA:lysophosphatidylglycerol acyltransferase 1 [Irineochytrium annulatum]|nr:Acyl-CoA:lysophosphatidylglycerol acyltransferase 1 [Irineochytrium annulatum]